MQEGQNSSTVIVFTVGTEDSDYMGPAETMRRAASVPAKVLEDKIDGFLKTMGQIVNRTSEQLGDFKVAQVHIQASITGKGEVGLVGLGASLGGTAGIVFVLERS